MAELVRRGVQDLCKTFSIEQKDALSALTAIKEEARNSQVAPKKAMNAALKEQKKARRKRNTSRR